MERHHGVAVAGNDLGARGDERGMHGNHGFRGFGQGQCRPLRLPEWRTAALQFAPHATVQNHHRSLFHITSLKVLMKKIHYVYRTYNY
ncbi:hypothetical protein D3C71_1690550 [compost metagenome]